METHPRGGVRDAPRPGAVVTAPVATYRLQFRPPETLTTADDGFGFDDATARVDYLRRLGISHLYLSPIAEAQTGSAHGYDVTDPNEIRAELGGRDAFERLIEAAREAGLGVIVDIVPNHMAASVENPWWRATLAGGRDAPESRVFDIDWDAGGGKVVLPTLGSSLDAAIEGGELAIVEDGGELAAAYYDDRFPIRGEAQATDDPRLVREILGRQRYELIDWRQGAARRNYRRFFDINHLAGVCVEDEEVFEATHRLVRELWESGLIDGVRVDHVDGMARPGEYLRRLRETLAPRAGAPALIYVEKILGERERLPEAWPVDGTTGYEALNDINRLFVSGAEAARFGAIAAGIGAEDLDGPALVVEAKREIAQRLFPGELERLATLAAPALGDTDLDQASRAIVRLVAHLDVYRTYLGDGDRRDEDAQRLRAAAKASGDETAERIAELAIGSHEFPQRERFVAAFEQFSGPVMAKGLEDTAHYRCATLTALNEVGAEPGGAASDPPAAFISAMIARAREAPAAMTPLTTHDTKRSEDARARILALAEAPEEWSAALRACKPELDAAAERELAPEDAIFLLQSAVGIWPEGGEPDEVWADRLAAYMEKALREGKRRSHWLEPDEAYESAVRRACQALPGLAARARLEQLVKRIEPTAGAITLVQTALRLLSPGVPDTYRSTEIVRRSLVDPDNRRAANWEALSARLARLEGGGPATDLNDRKMDLVRRLHALRSRRRSLFADGSFEAIEARAAGLLAFARARDRDRVIVAAGVRDAGRKLERLELDAGGAWRDALSGREVAGDRLVIDQPWRDWPVIVLEPA